ncbi:MAG: putative bifunctional diguanylate cyclase/phosphodiesterase [Burkholderiales bacterium]
MMRCWSEANKYTLYGIAAGCCFPLGSVFFLYFMHGLRQVNSLADLIVLAHEHILLYIIDTAPVFLGLAARYAGVRQDRLYALTDSLERQVFDKTESLREALEESRKANELITHMADHDSLTGLLNRRRFQDTLDGWLKYAVRYQRHGALLFLDLDNFKFINDTYGHKTGDSYLINIANLLNGTLRNTDILARWGGDEFAVFLPETSGSEAQDVANKLLAAFAQASFVFEGQLFQPSVSIGVAFVPEHTSDVHELVIYADAAMYEAKKAGRGCWRLYGASAPEVERVQSHLQWEARIRRALSNDQFMLLYQPLLNLKTGHTDAYEALLRMEDKEGQLIAPGLFLESAERANLSLPIDLMVIRKAIRRIAPLVKLDQEVWVSVNLSHLTLRDPDFPEKIELMLHEHAMPGTKLRFEITETTALRNMGLVRNISNKIKEFGGMLILDDFGLGPTSLQYLEKLSVDMIKLHPSLTRGLIEDSKSRIFVKNLAEMLHGFHLEVAVKSVENAELLNLLRTMEIDYAQGFAVGKPLESIELAENDPLS